MVACIFAKGPSGSPVHARKIIRNQACAPLTVVALEIQEPFGNDRRHAFGERQPAWSETSQVSSA